MPNYSLTTHEAAAILGLSQNYVARLCASGALLARKRKVGGREIWLIDRRSVLAYQQRAIAVAGQGAGRASRDSR